MAKDMKKVDNTKKDDSKTNKDETTVNEVKQPKVEKEKSTVESNLQFESLKEQVEMLKAMLLMNNPNAVKSTQDDGYIRADRSIQVMSLTPNLLNLSTQGNGKGKPFKFIKYGDVKGIIYKDLSDILAHYPNSAENGSFYIFDKDVVKQHGLESAYAKILDKKGIDSFLDKSVDEIKELFTKLSNVQQASVVNAIVNKIVAGEDVSTNKVNIIKTIYGEDIFQMAEDMLHWEEEMEELEK